METYDITADQVLALIEWPETYRELTEALHAARRNLVYALVDRMRRGETTEENDASFKQARVALRSYYNPDDMIVQIRTLRGRSRSFERGKGDIGKEMRAIQKAIRTLIGDKTFNMNDWLV